MRKQAGFKTIGLILVVALVIVALLPMLNPGGYKTFFGQPLDYDEARSAIGSVASGVDHKEQFVTRRARVALGSGADLKATLPEIDQFKITVDSGATDLRLELFVSSEKSGQHSDGWLNEVAREFNQAGVRLADGRRVGMAIRKIASGTGYQYIASGKYLPDGFSPSNHLWVEMARAHGVTMTPIRDRLVGNTAGVVLRTEVAERLRAQYGALDIPNLINAVVQGDLVMGYTNPFASSTGLNFLVTVLAEFSKGKSDEFLSDAVASAFESFQRGVPFVALTTLQMRESVQNEGSLDAFVMEYQTFAATPELATGYQFTPFGIRHDNPLYMVGSNDADRREGLELFAKFAEREEFQSRATGYGFNSGPEHSSSYALPPGEILVQAQKLWKDKKDAGRPITAVFLVDVSGSMRGARLGSLRKALVAGAQFVGPENSIGLVSFSTTVTTLLPVKRFNVAHKGSFVAAAEELRAVGNTAMYDGVAVSLDILASEVEKNPNAKPLLFVLSDGATNRGASFEQLAPIVEGLQVPVYTIGYEANLDELKRLSALVEAASIDAAAGEIEYKIGALLNAQM